MNLVNKGIDTVGLPNDKGYFGEYGGSYLPEALQKVMDEVAAAYERISQDPTFIQELKELEEHYRKLLTEKYEALTGEKGNSPDFMQELGALLVRYSINEEISRLNVHIAEYRRLLTLSEPVGKRLDFLCQEMQRECNTIASKSQLVEINLAVVSMKDNIEDIREQLRNIE